MGQKVELVAYFAVVIVISVGSFWLAGSLYGLFHRPAIYFPLSLATKMALCATFGAMLFMVGGVVLATLVFNAEMKNMDDYKQWPVLIVGALISVLCTVVIFFSVISLAWKILG